jgi:hypothetical protein
MTIKRVLGNPIMPFFGRIWNRVPRTYPICGLDRVVINDHHKTSHLKTLPQSGSSFGGDKDIGLNLYAVGLVCFLEQLSKVRRGHAQWPRRIAVTVGGYVAQDRVIEVGCP